jgi:predicted ATPase
MGGESLPIVSHALFSFVVASNIDEIPFLVFYSVTFITGLAGVGKSALVHEFIHANQVQSNRLARRRSSNESRGQNKLSFMHISMSFSESKEPGNSELGCYFLELHDEVEKIALNVSKEVTAQRNAITNKARGKMYQDSSDDDSSSSSSSSDDESIGYDELFVSSHREPTPDSQCELDEILSAISSKSKESLHSLLKYICKYVTQPFVMFFDSVECLDGRSHDVLSFLLRCSLPNTMIICASRPSGSAPDHPMQTLIQTSKSAICVVETLTVNPLSLEVTTKFTADSIKKETHEAAIVANAIYQKTMGVISYVINALQESVDNNVLHYDFSSEDWRWEISKIDLVTDYVSCDSSITDFVNSRLHDLPIDIQRMLTFMSCLSHDVKFTVSLLVDLMEIGGSSLDAELIEDNIEWAAREGFLTSLGSNSNQTFQFAHPLIREACQPFMTDEDRKEFSQQVFEIRFEKWNEHRPHNKWSKKEMTFLIEFLNLLDYSSGSRKLGNNRRNKGQLSKSMGPSVSPLAKEDGKDVRLSDFSGGAQGFAETEHLEPRRKQGGRRKGAAIALSKYMGDINDLRSMEISLHDQTEDAVAAEVKPSKTTMIELLVRPFDLLSVCFI